MHLGKQVPRREEPAFLQVACTELEVQAHTFFEVFFAIVIRHMELEPQVSKILLAVTEYDHPRVEFIAGELLDNE